MLTYDLRMSPPPFRAERTSRDGYDVVAATGELDVASAAALRRAALDERHREPVLVVDLSGVDFVDSSGIGGLVVIRREAMKRRAQVVVVATRGGSVERVLRMMRLDQVLAVHASLEEALGDYGEDRGRARGADRKADRKADEVATARSRSGDTLTA
jgi:anti-sigma B factor antagonist